MKRKQKKKEKGDMKKHNIGWRCCAMVVFGILCGCETVTVPPKPPSGPDSPNGLESATSQLISKMRSSYAFKRNYADVLKTKGRRPVVVVDKIDLLQVGKRLDSEIVRNRVQSSFNEAGLFTVKMDGFEEALDYHVTGYITTDCDGANPRIYLKILDINSGLIIWEDTQYNLKL